MTFHLDVLDASGQPERVTFSTLYSAPHSTHNNNNAATRITGSTRVATTAPTTLRGTTKHSNATTTTAATTLETWKGVGGGGGADWATAGKGEAAADAAAGAALVKRGGALRCPVSFDTSRSRGWSVVAIDMVALMREGTGTGTGGGREYGVLRAVRLGSNMVVRGVYASDCVYSPHTLPKDMAFRPPGTGVDWETAYSWLWLPEVRNGEGGGVECGRGSIRLLEFRDSGAWILRLFPPRRTKYETKDYPGGFRKKSLRAFFSFFFFTSETVVFFGRL